MRIRMYWVILGLTFFLLPTVSLGQQAKNDIGQAIDDQADRYRDMALQIWNLHREGFVQLPQCSASDLSCQNVI